MRIAIAVIGLTGSGKSTISNTLIGKDNVFKESNEVESQTQEIKGCDGEFNQRLVNISDTPGFFDSNGRDNIHLDEMVQYLRNKKELKSFIVTLNFGNDRIDEANLRLFQILSNMYPGKKWYNHICVVWTKYYNFLPENLRDKKPKIEGFKRFLKKNFKEISEQEINSIPQFFIDSVEARNPNSNLRPYLNQIIDWSSELSPVIESLGNIVNVDKVIKNKIEEIEKNYIKSSNGSLQAKLLTKILVDRKRYKLIHYDNTESYSDYEELKNTLKTKEIRVRDITISGPHKVETSCTCHRKKFIIITIDKEYERHGYYYEVRATVNEERIGLHVNGVPAFGDWKELKRSANFNYTTSTY